jgi:hypothetical protein
MYITGHKLNKPLYFLYVLYLSGSARLKIWKIYPINSYKKELKLLFRFYSGLFLYKQLLQHCLSIPVKLCRIQLKKNQPVIFELKV